MDGENTSECMALPGPDTSRGRDFDVRPWGPEP